MSEPTPQQLPPCCAELDDPPCEQHRQAERALRRRGRVRQRR